MISSTSNPELQVRDCAGNLIDITQLLAFDQSLIPLTLGKIGFGGAAGYTPCSVVLTKETTWGKVKTMYNNSK